MYELSAGHLGTIYNVVDFLKDTEMGDVEFNNRSGRILKDSRFLIDIMISNEILFLKKDKYKLSDELIKVLELDRTVIKREILWLYIMATKPAWSLSLHLGFSKMKSKVKVISNTNQLFNALGLLPDTDKIPPPVGEWWNRANLWSRNIANQKEQVRNKEIGDRGEELSVDYEMERTLIPPKWESKDSDKYGYDIESVVDQGVDSPIYIEVKATTQSLSPRVRFFVSRNEGDACMKHGEKYFFHLWVLADKGAKLLIIKGEDVMAHFPENKGDGLWNEVKVPFSTFDWKKSVDVNY